MVDFVECVAAPCVVVKDFGWLFPLHGSGELDVAALDEPVGRTVERVVGQEVVVELPEKLQGDPPVRSHHVMIGLLKHGAEEVKIWSLLRS